MCRAGRIKKLKTKTCIVCGKEMPVNNMGWVVERRQDYSEGKAKTRLKWFCKECYRKMLPDYKGGI